jgi:signal transduction histidine kinase
MADPSASPRRLVDADAEIEQLRAEIAEIRARLGASEQAAAEREDGLRSIAHGIRTPLSSLLLQAHMLERTLDPDDPGRRRVEVILANAQRIATMLEDLEAHGGAIGAESEQGRGTR